jgi:hypothetical protein
VRSHGLSDDIGSGDETLKSWCHCGQVFVAARGSYERSLRAIRRAYEDHRGFTNAAGMGGDLLD